MAFSVETLIKKDIFLPFLKNFATDEVLFHQGQIGNTLFIIAKGRVHLLLDSTSGEHVFGVVTPGDILGERAILLENGHQRAFSAQATEPVTAIELNGRNLIEIQKKDPDAILDILKRSIELSSKRLELANLLARTLRGSDPRKRFCECVLYVSHTAGSLGPKGIKIPKLKEALSYFLDFSSQERDNLLRDLIDLGALEVHDQNYFLVNQHKLMSSCIPPVNK